MTSEYGRYRIVEELGKGTMGVVYKAHDPQIDRMVALKVLRPDRVTSETFVARFLKEARAIGRLSHPRIVTIYDVGEDHGTVYIAMEFLKGEPFNDVLRSGRLSLCECVKVACQIVDTLDYAHRNGIVHRDIKPSNIIFCEGHDVKLTDFGIARIEDAGAGYQTQAGEILGTPVYMSPEQVMGQTVDGRSDLFSAGVILYEMAAGRRPFTGNNIAAIFRAITNDQPESPANMDPFIPKALSDVILKSLAKQPEARFQTGRQFAEALETIQPMLQTPLASESPDRRVKRRVVLTGAAIMVLILGAGGYYLLGRNAAVPPHAQVNTTSSAQQALLKINSDPAGAQVFVDNIEKGTTPLDLPLALGKYELRLSMPGYLVWEGQVQLDTLNDTPLNIPMHTPE
ncbi:MAG: serine/threonine protein kinase [Desulfatitalea sp.]|nr:protein kinase [Desulfatitalea sp.]NNK01989.1 serine/threonine protein kinase [Desulfatitalea sp.]